jgi:hypothetical protein
MKWLRKGSDEYRRAARDRDSRETKVAARRRFRIGHLTQAHTVFLADVDRLSTEGLISRKYCELLAKWERHYRAGTGLFVAQAGFGDGHGIQAR